jgi:CubicO group peptidase (beta-lactamase class C family)
VDYRSECNTRFGNYPYCKELVLPSYSTAKSVFGGLGLLALEQRYPGVKDALISDLVPACKANDSWEDVTIEHALNMVTGHYDSNLYEVDEAGPDMVKFFDKTSHQDRIALACKMYKKQQSPGTKWVYHTSDTYLAATAMNNFINQKQQAMSDIYDDILVELVWKKLGLSPLTYKTRRSYDQVKQGFAGWGLSFLPSDVAQLANALIPTDEAASALTMLDKTELAKALQMDGSDRGVKVIGELTRYKHGFWAYNVQSALNCKNPLWLPFMSGYGGISVVMMPNNMAYYYFSDNMQFAWVEAVREAHKLRPMCQAA